MADRKQTPDILSEIMGAASSENQSPPPSKLKPVQATKAKASSPVGKTTQVRRADTKDKWEYQLVSFQDHKGWRARYVNGVEQVNWMDNKLMHDYVTQMADEGWELVAANSGERMYGLSDNYQLFFKRRYSR